MHKDTIIKRVQAAISDSGMTMEAIADKSGIEQTKLYARLKGTGEFTVSEAKGIAIALQLSDRERDDLFFGKDDT